MNVRESAIEAERALLGGVIVEPQVFEDVELTPSHFYRAAHGVIWSAIGRIAAAGGAVDLVTIKAALGSELDRCGGAVYLASLIDGTPRSTNVAHYASLVRDLYVRRRVEQFGREIIASAAEQTASELVERCESSVAQLRDSIPRVALQAPGEGMEAAYRALEESATNRQRGVLTGLKSLDLIVAGFRPGQLILLGARPSVGKTALAMNFAIAAGNSGPVLFASLEMSSLQLRLRELALRAKVRHEVLDAGRVGSHESSRVAAGLQALQDGGVFVLDRPGATVAEIRAGARRLMALTRTAPVLLIVDYLQLIRTSDRSESRQVEVTHVSSELKRLARELNVPLLALSQLSRQVESRTDGRPRLNDLRDSGSLEQDADVVLLLHRPAMYDVSDDRAEVIVAKHRNGQTGYASLRFEAPLMAFTDPDADKVSPITR